MKDKIEFEATADESGRKLDWVTLGPGMHNVVPCARYRITFERVRTKLPDGASWSGDAIVWCGCVFRAGVVRGDQTFPAVDSVTGCNVPTFVVDAFREEGLLPKP